MSELQSPVYPHLSCPPQTALATVCFNFGDYRRAEQLAQAALLLQPQDPTAHTILASLHWLAGDLTGGWVHFEFRPSVAAMARALPWPRWHGQPCSGQRVFVFPEGGLGDQIRFVRFAAALQERGAQVVVGTGPPLGRLFQRAAGVARVVTDAPPVGEVDLYVPLLSLPGMLNVTLATIPPTPYLRPDPKLVRGWRKRLARHTGFKVGICWLAGQPGARNWRRSCMLADLAPLAHVAHISLYSLQKGEDAAQTYGRAGMVLRDLTSHIEDFADTVALIACLDLIITVDTSVAHLAGALGKPVWTLLPSLSDSCWLTAREDSPWYPSMKLFRQHQPGEWIGVVQQVVESLAKEGNGRKSPRNRTHKLNTAVWRCGQEVIGKGNSRFSRML